MNKHTIGAALITAAVVLLISCNQNPVGIFATIEATDAIDLDTAMPDNAMIQAIGEFGASDSDTGHHLLAATGLQLLQRPLQASDGSPQWSGTVFPTDQSYVATFVVHPHSPDGGDSTEHIFAIFAEESADSTDESPVISLFTTPASGITGGSFSADSWSRLPLETTGSLHSLLRTETQLFVSSRSGDDYGLYRLSHDGETWAAQAATSTNNEGDQEPAVLSRVVRSVKWNGTTYILTATELYSIDGADTLTRINDMPRYEPTAEDEAEEEESESPAEILTAAAVIDGYLVVTSSQGFIYYNTNNEWKKTNTLGEDSPERLQSIAAVPLPDTTEKLMLVGTRNTGLAHLTDGFSLQNLREGEIEHINYGGSELSSISIEHLMIPRQEEDAKQLIFAGSAGNGLWRGTVSSTSIRWGRE